MAIGTLQTTFQVLVQTDDGEVPFEAIRVVSLREDRRLGRPAELWATVQLPANPPGDLMVGGPAELSITRGGGEPRWFKGIVESVTAIGSSIAGGTGVDHYRFHVVSPLALLDHSVGCQIFQELDVKEIVTKVLEQEGIDATHQDWRLTGEYPKREYCVQYNESALAFVSRLLEDEGIYHYSEFGDEGETLVFVDDSTAADPLPNGEEAIPFRPLAGQDSPGECIHAIHERHRVVSGKFVLRDFDFTRPELDQTCEAESDVDTDLEVYDYPGGYTEPSDGSRLVQLRLEAEQVDRHTMRVDADCPRLEPGYQIEVTEGLHDEINGKYVLLAVVHELLPEQSPEQMADATGEASAGARHETYVARAVLLPADIKYRLPVTTPKPTIHGPQTAQVVCPAGSPVEEIHTDEWGRAKVKFHWDLAPEVDDRASCWMRVQQLHSSGSMALPRIDWEVIVEFLEGDPDRPIITGRLYNGVFMPPYALPEGRSRTTVRSNTTPGGGGSNEVRFEDTAGGEEIMVHAQYDMTVTVANNKTKTVTNSEAKKVAVDSELNVSVNQTTQVTQGERHTIGANHDVTVGKDRKFEVNAVGALNVSGDSTNDIGGNHFEMDGDPLTALVNLAVEKVTEFAKAKAGELLGQVDAYVQGKVEQVMGPINNMQDRVGQVADAMDAVSGGNLSETTTALRSAAEIPQAGELGNQMLDAMREPVAGTGAEMGVQVELTGEETGVTSQIGLDQVVDGAIEQGVRAGGDVVDGALHDLFGDALGLDSDGGGGASMDNVPGPDLQLGGIAETDREQGPGHSLSKTDGDQKEKVGTLKTMVALTGVNTEVVGDMKQTVGIGRAELVLGDRTETVGGDKDETCTGLICLVKGDVSEKSGGSKKCMVGGAIVDLLKANKTVESASMATFIGALHKVTAKEKITFKAGSSEVVIEGGGVTFDAKLVAFLAPKIQLTKKVAEN